MHDKIKELAVQAGITTNLDTDYFEKDINKWVDYYSEKFAELIVKECVRYFNEDYQRDFNTLWREDLSKGMKEHFGVEE